MTSQTDRKNGITGNLGIKAPVRCATTANITLSGLQTIDGITVVADDRVLVKNQTDTSENGVYNASSSAWARALDFDGINDIVNGTLVAITNGTSQANQIWQLVATNPITIDTSALTFTYILSTNSSDNLSDLAALASVANLETLANLASVANLVTAAVGKGADIASASTVNLTTATGEYVNITGTTTITAITLTSGSQRLVRFTGILTLTHGASLVLPSAANITTAAGDFALFVGDASSVVRCAGYFRASGSPLIPALDATESVAGIAEIASQAETIAGTASKIVDPQKLLALFGTSDRSTNGYARLPVKVGGAFTEIIIQWGFLAGTNTLVTFPLAFPTVARVGFAMDQTGPATSYAYQVYNLTTTQMTINRTGSTVTDKQWIAIGY